MNTNLVTFCHYRYAIDRSSFTNFSFNGKIRSTCSRYVWDEEEKVNISRSVVDMTTLERSHSYTNLNQEGVINDKFFFKAEAHFREERASYEYIFVVSVDDRTGGSQQFHETAKEILVKQMLHRGLIPDLNFEMESITEEEALSLLKGK